MNRKRFIQAALAGLGAGLLAGCGTVNRVMNLVGFAGTRLAWKEVVIAAADGANQNSAVAVDIVLVLEEAAIEKLSALPASKWFATRADLLKTFPGQFSYKSWEITPGQILRLPGSVFGSPNVLTVFVFADYLAPGEHRMRVDQLQNGIMIQLAARGFTVQPHKVD